MDITLIALLFNYKENRWHPIIFRDAPLPGPFDDTKPKRYKSKGHHPLGFATREEAEANIKENLDKMKAQGYPEPRVYTNGDIKWDNEDFPAMIAFEGEDGTILFS